MPQELQMLVGSRNWSAPGFGGGGALSFHLTDPSYTEIYGCMESAPVNRAPNFSRNYSWRLRASDDREVIANYIVLQETIQPRFSVLQGGYKYDMAARCENIKSDFKPPAVITSFQELGFGNDVIGSVAYAVDANDRIRGEAIACSADMFLELDLTAATAAFQAKDRRGQDNKSYKVDLTEITADQFKQLTVAAFNKILGRSKPSGGEYAELIAILKEFRPLLFKSMPESVISDGLKTKEQTVTGAPGPTLNLKAMVERIAKAKQFMSQPIAGGA